MIVVEYSFDGASSPHNHAFAGWGWCCWGPNASPSTVHGYGVLPGDTTSNEAEYTALYHAVLHALVHRWPTGCHFIFQGDSKLVVEQVSGIIRARNPYLRRHYERVMHALEPLPSWELRWIPRENNRQADELSRRGRR